MLRIVRRSIVRSLSINSTPSLPGAGACAPNAQAERSASSRTAQACCWTAQRLRCRLLLPSSASRHKALLVIANEADLISDLRDERYLLDGLLVWSRPREHVRDFLDFALFRDFHDLGTIRL